MKRKICSFLLAFLLLLTLTPAALADGVSTVKNVALSQDIEATLRCMAALGASWERTDKSTLRVTGIGGKRKPFPELPRFDCGESGSTLRFFIPLALDGRGPVCLIGHGRLMQRPLTVYQNLFAPLGVVWRQEGDALTILAGEELSDEAFQEIVDAIEEAQPDLEIDAHRGEQPLYPVIFSIE